MATATQSAHRKELDTKKRSTTSRHFEDALRQRIVGKDQAVQALVELYQVFCAGLRAQGRPAGNLLWSAPLRGCWPRRKCAPGDALLIDRHPGEKGLAFIRDTEQRSSYLQMSFVPSSSSPLAAAEVTG
jgi:hypothetical protein